MPMKIYTSLDQIPAPFPHACVTIGNFDGVHMGHQQLFNTVSDLARRHRGTGVAITFEPHPLQVVRPEIGIKLISTYEQKVELISMAGIDALLVIPFTQEFAAMDAEQFVDQVLVGTLGVRELVVGYDYAFGKGRRGDADFLEACGKKQAFTVRVIPAFKVDGMVVSSSKVRELVAAGRMEDVTKLLGRYYQMRGVVQVGKKRGGSILGFPTANLSLNEHDLCPKHGVYVTQVVYGGKCYGGVLNIGYNPTFADSKLAAETHIFDFNQDIYGQPIKINLLKHLRGERKFSGPEELAAQIARDVTEAKEVLAAAEEEFWLYCAEKFND
ncbi:bifunctional riboflavin kinase/FAD synthetase [Desulfurivibrio alkaliphilus]|uniref:Riboflavin biosynthesis protein n=1 Tax=Desulfurivibrio alkaliphilus (strain DSM 19089 / UNIQEM U267 / AHT2) TaxID=589865 RepID=D6Z477_DESAT|nr:bifunctional riboflavin kinase/FAD synthetase [Desulfurivibrio alkaliphilus]ADH86352.1 riboflavin biosynthesis protein RibF [Desulfurivibrio alkaliphilus AHT 2]